MLCTVKKKIGSAYTHALVCRLVNQPIININHLPFGYKFRLVVLPELYKKFGVVVWCSYFIFLHHHLFLYFLLFRCWLPGDSNGVPPSHLPSCAVLRVVLKEIHFLALLLEMHHVYCVRCCAEMNPPTV